MLDLYEAEANQALARLPGTKNPEAGIFDGFLRGAGMGAVRTGIKTLVRPVAMVGSLGAIAYDKDLEIHGISRGTESQDRYFKAMDEILDSAIEYWTPRPNEVGLAGEVVGQLLGLLPIVVASPAAAVGGTQLDVATDLAKKGVGDWRAQAVGAAQATGLGAGIWMPILGQTLAQRIVVGGAGFNVVQGIATRGAGEMILGDHPAAKEFKALDGTALTLDVLLGMAFGTITHLSPAQRAQGTAAWERIRNWAEGLPPSSKDSIAVLRQAQHLNHDSLAGKPAEPIDLSRAVDRNKLALEQAVRDEPVTVEALPHPRMEADEARWLEATARAEEMRKEGERVSEEYGLWPEELTPQPRTEGPPAQRAESSSPPPPEAGAKAEPARPEADALSREADRIAAELPEVRIRVGEAADGTPVTKTATELLADTRAEAAKLRADSELFEVAAACMLGRG